MPSPAQRIRESLTLLYGSSRAHEIWPRLEKVLTVFQQQNPARRTSFDQKLPWSEQDAILITYADQFSAPGQTPLQTLAEFLEKYLGNAISAVHLLPFYPYSSDDGFSIIDYRGVDPRAGTWDDIPRLDAHYRLMFDAVINHISQHSAWFQGFLKDEEPFRDYFIEISPDLDLSAVTRPRALPLLTPYETLVGIKHVWTTFSEDQIDLNYANPQVLLEIIALLLFYVSKGAEIIRLDAIAYLWKAIGTSCIHLPQTHEVVKLWRAVLDAVAPDVILITETNVPHQENISYFGDGTDEAQMVYQFPLAPLILHAFQTGDVRKLTEWAASLKTPSPRTTFFNFIASHDGIGVRPAEGLLTPDEITALADRTLARGGQVSYRNHPDGSRSVYELNITLYDQINDPAHPESEMDIRRFLTSQAIMLSLAGVPGIYVQSLFGSRNCQDCLTLTGRARTINREKFQIAELLQRVEDHHQHEGRILEGMINMLMIRRNNPAFHPNAGQRVLALDDRVFAVLRGVEGTSAVVLCLSNVSELHIEVTLLGTLFGDVCSKIYDLFDGKAFSLSKDNNFHLTMGSFQTRWVTSQSPVN